MKSNRNRVEGKHLPGEFSRRRFVASALAALAGAASGANAWAQTGGKPARIITGFPPGGSTDIVARVLADRMRGQYAPNIIVENKPGAGGRIAVEFVKAGDADGSLMLLSPAGMFTIYPHVYRKLEYDALADFTPVSTLVGYSFAITVGPSVPAQVRTLADLMQWYKANPKSAAYGTPGAGSAPHFIGTIVARLAGVELNHVPYKGMAPVMQDLMAGQIPVGMLTVGDAVGHAKDTKLRVLATTGPARSPFLPNIPTAAESGFKDLVADEWFGMFVPSKTPPQTVERLSSSIREALKSAPVQQRFAEFGLETLGTTPAQFRQMVRSEHAMWAPIVKASGFTAVD
jgi:tripartite-type tricarboxylate transporter receptor subunit TctC